LFAAATKEKEQQIMEKLERQGKGVEGSVLDPLMAVLIQVRGHRISSGVR
jgi:hypothetical protein